MNKYTNYETSTILTVAGKVLDAINRLPELLKDANIALPAEYSNTQKGGYLSLYRRNPFIKSGELLFLAKIGEIPDIDDADFGSKNEKYQKYTGKKSRALIYEPGITTSEKTTLGIKGGIAINDDLVLSFSGKTELEDQLLVVVTTLVCKQFFYDTNAVNASNIFKLESIQGENPFLSKDIVNTVARYCAA
jgi:hypothetical protein